ncbi:MAG: LytTR family DNA-binding domain-containing protein [Lachnospiraceae bacterium]|nr:LytTR family DNA-binding domain-containing protein [Lachnospiraceae bacterium]
MYRIGICDDDKILCSVLEEQIYALEEELKERFEIEVWYSGETIQDDLEKGMQFDLVFLDIELVQKNGIEVGRFIRGDMEDIKTHIVYISSKQDYAMKLFKTQPLDFLIKPIKNEQLKEVLERSICQNKVALSYFEYQKGGAVHRIPVEEIIYFMSMNKKIIMKLKKNETEEFYGKLKDTIKQLPSSFMMIHQSYVINQQYVYEYSYENVKMMDGAILSISKPYRKEVRSRVRQYQKEKINQL